MCEFFFDYFKLKVIKLFGFFGESDQKFGGVVVDLKYVLFFVKVLN